MPTVFPDATEEEIDACLNKSAKCFNFYRKLDGHTRAEFLFQIARELEDEKEKIISVSNQETNLGIPRLQAERIRTISEIEVFANLAKSGEWIETSFQETGESPLLTNLCKYNVPVGPVLVIGACNFPLAISVVGTDTISALAVGCPVIVKAHPAHPKTCQLLADLVYRAMEKSGIPKGVFQLLHGKNYQITKNLVNHSKTACVAFTGSLEGGSALSKVASQRKTPIPFHAEMGSLNPVIFLPKIVSRDAAKLAYGYVQAVNLFAGQMCTKPGALFLLKSKNNPTLLRLIEEVVSQQEILPMLNQGVYQNYEESVRSLSKEVSLLATNEQNRHSFKNPAYCRIFQMSADEYLEKPEVRTEAFGPASLIIECENENELFTCIDTWEGSLTASLHAEREEISLISRIIPKLESLAGRILWNGFPPGVTPGPATHHGGPWPATTDSRFSSIGKQAYQRFVRPLCKQGFPQKKTQL